MNGLSAQILIILPFLIFLTELTNLPRTSDSSKGKEINFKFFDIFLKTISFFFDY